MTFDEFVKIVDFVELAKFEKLIEPAPVKQETKLIPRKDCTTCTNSNGHEQGCHADRSYVNKQSGLHEMHETPDIMWTPGICAFYHPVVAESSLPQIEVVAEPKRRTDIALIFASLLQTSGRS